MYQLNDNNVHHFSVTDWLNYLEHRHTKEIQLGLSRVKKVAEALNLLHFNAPVITVAGTNGKGSTIAALEAIYTSAGYQVAVYTSPHLLCFNERIRLKKTNILDADLINAFLAIHAIPGSNNLTYFEMVTLAALWYFKQNTPDIILLEVGMGGRLDATNCIDADLAIITTIDLDHEAWLGATRAKIATEKAGIFRPHQHAVYADSTPPQTLLDKASALEIKLLILHQAYDFKVTDTSFIFSTPDGFYLKLSRPCIHSKAFASAIMASLTLQPILPVSKLNYLSAAKQVTILGRQQWLPTKIPTLLDVAHNLQAVKHLADYLKTHTVQGQVHAVFSGLRDKTLYDLMQPMRAYVHTWYLTTLNHARGATSSLLKAAYYRAKNEHPKIVFDDPTTAFTAAIDAAKPGDIIVVYGSFFLVSAIMHAHVHQGEQNELSS
ncbi:MAG: bifunctional folylpolyglutamate synthase/dihydrofolate synthase [Gammaproteobacteria bacterium]|nr:bifunctional folylpolyglutamate synthase/dihydrofolate synthase [Gammaproteobacteria bacterium]MCH9764172.1 bifunctional folylpolyglutamate synthase/dihydrofolate synthase [Gammaproteobacteria bacterium]